MKQIDNNFDKNNNRINKEEYDEQFSIMNQQRIRKQKEVKSKIEQIMLCVKQQKQHIQNKLATNDQKIQLYCEQYEGLKQRNDYSNLRRQQIVLLQQISNGLIQNGIDARQIIGGKQIGLNKLEQLLSANQLSQLSTNKHQTNSNIINNGISNNNMSNKKYKQLNNETIIAIQTMLIDKLATQLKIKIKSQSQLSAQNNNSIQ